MHPAAYKNPRRAHGGRVGSNLSQVHGQTAFMLATQDVQPAAGVQLAFEERSDPDAVVAEELKQALHERHLLDLRTSRLAARFAVTNYYDRQGFASPIDWIRFNCHLTSVAAADLIAVGENLERLPQSVQAVTDGEIGFPHLKAMARTADAVGAGFDEAVLLPKARDNSAGKFYSATGITGWCMRATGRSFVATTVAC